MNLVKPNYHPLSAAQEDYLKAIYLLSERGRVSTMALARYLSVKPASVTGMLKKLSRMGLVLYTPYKSVHLTEEGKTIALEIIRHHRLLETFLVKILGFSWDQIHDEADRLEHHISEELEARIASLLGHPDRDPHGDPIPSPTLTMPVSSPGQLLINAEPGEYSVLRICNQDPAALRVVEQLALIPGNRVRVIAHEPHSLRIETKIGRILLPHVLAQEIEVETA